MVTCRNCSYLSTSHQIQVLPKLREICVLRHHTQIPRLGYSADRLFLALNIMLGDQLGDLAQSRRQLRFESERMNLHTEQLHYANTTPSNLLIGVFSDIRRYGRRYDTYAVASNDASSVKQTK